jgi:hypothetical protein
MSQFFFRFPRAYRLKPVAQREEDALSLLTEIKELQAALGDSQRLVAQWGRDNKDLQAPLSHSERVVTQKDQDNEELQAALGHSERMIAYISERYKSSVHKRKLKSL